MQIRQVPYKLDISGGPKRSPGLHLSDIIRDLAIRGKILDSKYEHDDINDRPEFAALGIAFEEWVVKQHPEICFHPGEIIVDGIPMTVDGISMDRDEMSIFGVDGMAVHEIKVTWKSARVPIDERWMWLTQTKGYLHGVSVMEKVKIRKAFIHAFFVNGNYSRTPGDPLSGPRYLIWELNFTNLEIAENWNMIRNHRDRMMGKGVKVKMGRK